MSTKATAARSYEYGEPDVFRFETMDVPDSVGHEVLVQGCAEALETLVRDADGPEGLYVNLAIQVEACAVVIADPRLQAATVTGSEVDPGMIRRHGPRVMFSEKSEGR